MTKKGRARVFIAIGVVVLGLSLFAVYHFRDSIFKVQKEDDSTMQNEIEPEVEPTEFQTGLGDMGASIDDDKSDEYFAGMESIINKSSSNSEKSSMYRDLAMNIVANYPEDKTQYTQAIKLAQRAYDLENSAASAYVLFMVEETYGDKVKADEYGKLYDDLNSKSEASNE